MSNPGDDLRSSLMVPPSSHPLHSPRSSGSMSGSESLASLRSNRPVKADTNVNYPAEPAAPMSGPIKENMMTEAASKLPVYGVHEYLSEYQAANKDLIAACEAAKSPAAKKLKMDKNAIPGPVAVGAKSSKHTILLNDAHQALALPQPHFTFEGSGDSGWTAQVSFPGLDIVELQDIKLSDRFNSKQEAKEAVSELALGIVERLKDEGRIKTPIKGKRKKIQTSTEPEAPSPNETQPPVENYIGQILEFQRSISGPPPIYTDYQSGTRFACLLEIEGQPAPFGSLTSLHGSKKAARHDAARCAVAHFKAQGIWPDTFTDAGGIRKKKASAAAAQQRQPTVIPSRIPQSSSNSNNNSTSTPIPAPTPSTPAPSNNNNNNNTIKPPSPPETSYASQVAALAAALSLPPPEYIDTPCADAPDFHTVVCVFRHGEPHAGPFGEVRNIFGRKKAREECARLTLAVLDEVRRVLGRMLVCWCWG